jgi:hypothetical protein
MKWGVRSLGEKQSLSVEELLDQMDTTFIRRLGEVLAADQPEDEGIPSPVSETTRRIVRFGQTLLLIGVIIDYTNTNPDILIFSASIKLFAGFLFIYASLRESIEQTTPSGGTTLANRWKITGSIITTVGAIILFAALLRETAIVKATGETGQVQIPVFFGGTGAFVL